MKGDCKKVQERIIDLTSSLEVTVRWTDIGENQIGYEELKNSHILPNAQNNKG